MENSIELTTTHNVDSKKNKKIKGGLVKRVDFPYKAKQIFGLGDEKWQKKSVAEKN